MRFFDGIVDGIASTPDPNFKLNQGLRETLNN
jgi:hypothetical protein